MRALVGSGMNTIIGVDLLPGQGGTFQPDAAELHFGNGDETVPARSATQGTPGTADPLGENIPISYQCHVSHVPLAGDDALTAAGAGDFLASGDDLTASTQPCSNGGFSVEIFDVTIGPASALASAQARAASGQSLADAETAGDIDLIRFPSMAFAVTNDFNPVTLDIPDSDAHVVVRRLDGENQGPAQPFGPFADGIELTTTAGGTIGVGSIPTNTSPTPETTPTPTVNPLCAQLRKKLKKTKSKSRKRNIRKKLSVLDC